MSLGGISIRKAVQPLFFVLGLSSCSSVFYQGDRVLYQAPETLGLKKEDVRFEAGDGHLSFAWHLPPSRLPAKGTIVQFHGNAENISSHYLTLVWLVHEGYRLFTWDYPGYGLSEGKADPDSVYQASAQALREAWTLHQRVAKPGEKFIVYGQSLGGAIALRALQDFESRERVALLVMDSSFLSYKGIAMNRLASHWLTWIFSPLGYLLVTDRYSPREWARRNPMPLLVIHDRNDPIVPFKFGQEIYDCSPAAIKEIWTLDQRRHIGVFAEDNPGWRRKFVEFLK